MIGFRGEKGGTDLLTTLAVGLRTAWLGTDERRTPPSPASATTATATAKESDDLRLVSCVMPAYNEREVIRQAVRRVQQALERLTAGFEIIVVDDGSTDGTGRILDEMADDRLRIIHFPENAGYGRALRAGFEAAVHPLVFFTDSDDQFDPVDLRLLLSLARDGEIVVGYRSSRRDGAVRSLLSGGYNTLVRALLGITVRDVNCAFKLVRRDTLATLGLTSDGYAINAEMLARAARAGLHVCEVAVSHQQRRSGRSKVGFGDIPRSLAQVVELRHSLRNGTANGGAVGERP
jgi:glycosyltransferase involved in cell wall biosynthesis